jgi:hypothetical protein
LKANVCRRALCDLALCAYSQEARLIPEYLPSISVTNTAPFNLSSFALSLLLVGLPYEHVSVMPGILNT